MSVMLHSSERSLYVQLWFLSDVIISKIKEKITYQFPSLENQYFYNIEGYKRDTFTILKGTNVTPLQY
jgi:hypothetical protein